MENNSVSERDLQGRTELLLGRNNLLKLQAAKVIIFGVGGVGSWCAEGLVRSGIKNITIVDSDSICVSNCNRQLMATTKTIGQVKVDALRQRLLDINPNANIVALQKIYEPQSADDFHLESFDFIVDAIDSLKNKADLILRATALQSPTILVSSMGAALRRNPFMIRMAEFGDVKGDPLARALRKKFKYLKASPSKKFVCVYSEETPMQNVAHVSDCDAPQSPQQLEQWSASKAQTNGSLCHITASFGMALAGIILNKIIDRA